MDTFKSDQKNLYRYLKSLRGSSNSKSFIGTSGEVICKAVDTAAAFNEYFHSTFSQSSFVLPHISSLPQPESTLSSISIDSGDVFDVLRSMGCDGVSPKILRHCATSLCEPLADLFNKSLDTSILTASWKQHMISPIPKSGDNSKISNWYRFCAFLLKLWKQYCSFLQNHLVRLAKIVQLTIWFSDAEI